MFVIKSLLKFAYFMIICLILPVGGNGKFYDIGFVANFTKFLQAQHDFNCFVTYAFKRELEILPIPNHYARSLERILAEEVKLPVIIWGSSKNISFWRLLSYRTLVIASIEHLLPGQEAMLDTLQVTLDRRHDVHLLFILKNLDNIMPTARQLTTFFEWCWRNKFVNVALTYQELVIGNASYSIYNQLFSYTPFPTVTLLNVTNYGYAYDWPKLSLKDVQGYVFRLPIFQDLPAISLVNTSKNELPNWKLEGVVGLMMSSYFAWINGSMQIEPLPHVNRDNFHEHTLLAAALDEVAVVMHPYSNMDLNSNQTNGVFSFTLSKTCLLVPWQRISPLTRFIQYNVYQNGWLFILLVVLLPLGWWICKRDAGRGLSHALMIYYLQSLECRIFRGLPTSYKVFHLGLLMGAFLLRNMRSADLSAAFSVQLLGPQINSVQDFLHSGLQIMITETDVAMYFTSGLMPDALQQRLLIVNRSTFEHHRDQLNASYAYCSSSEYAYFVNMKQKYLPRPIFRWTDKELCTPSSFRGIPIQWNSPFKESIFDFYLQTKINGLQQEWSARAYRYAIQLVYKDVPKGSDPKLASIDMKDIKVVLRLYLYSISLCLLSLIGELLWKRFVVNRKRK